MPRSLFLTYTSEHLLYVWILLLRHIADASTGTCHCRDKIWSYSLSILQNTYSSYVWILLLRHIADATTVTCHC
jgi:hypothetical protein